MEKTNLSDVLTVYFDRCTGDEAGLCVSRQQGNQTKVLKMELGEQADILYRLLTEQTLKAEIKPKS